MSNLYNGYCYKTIEEAADHELSTYVVFGKDFISSITSYSVTSQTTVDFTVEYNNFSDFFSSSHHFTRVYPSCSVVGSDPGLNSSGLTVSDAVDLSWSVVAVLVSAYCFKILIRFLRSLE
ncbi:hypothetical protein [Methylomonas sp. HYX-M1]|uniref:hypothetical protein n=1 Tax=Methylomonas sp. HYX-M1 TaxID=3139307 RepID=UPI00345BAA7D